MTEPTGREREPYEIALDLAALDDPTGVVAEAIDLLATFQERIAALEDPEEGPREGEIDAAARAIAVILRSSMAVATQVAQEALRAVYIYRATPTTEPEIESNADPEPQS